MKSRRGRENIRGMMKRMKATAVAGSNIAFIKYWGKKDERWRIPENGSISMTLDKLKTTTTVEFSKRYKDDKVIIDGEEARDRARERVVKHLDRVRILARVDWPAKVVSVNSFPQEKGLSSSASAFAALSLATTAALGLKLTEKRLSRLARLGSGSACRSVPGGFVEWMGGKSDETSYAKTIFPSDYWGLVDLVVITRSERKVLSTTAGQALADSSPFYKERLRRLGGKIKRMKQLIKERKFSEFGQLCEQEALELHTIMLTSKPALFYWQPASVRVMRMVRNWREQGLESYFTVNTGQDVHVLVLESNYLRLERRLRELEGVEKVVVARPGKGVRLVKQHWF